MQPVTIVDIESITKNVTDLLIKKSADYGNAGLELGENGVMVYLYTKIRRYQSLVEKKNRGETPNFESLEDTLNDIIGWAILGRVVQEREKGICR